MDDRVNRGHANGGVNHTADHRQTRVNKQQLLGDIGSTRQRFAKGIKPFGPEVLHATHPHQRQKDHRDKGNTQAPQPVQQSAPQIGTRGQSVQSYNDR